MKKRLCMLLLAVMSAQVWPFDALATAGMALTGDEPARACALAGLGVGGQANPRLGRGAYFHPGIVDFRSNVWDFFTLFITEPLKA